MAPFQNVLFILLLLPLQIVTAVLQNITIDDYYGDPSNGLVPTFAPGGWIIGQSCSGCSAHASALMAYNGTWHDSTTQKGGIPHSATILFNGESLYGCAIRWLGLIMHLSQDRRFTCTVSLPMPIITQL